MRHVNITSPAGYKATSIAALSDGDCSPPLYPFQQYYILFDRVGFFPQYWRVDDAGNVLEQRLLQQYEWGCTAADLKRDRFGHWRLLESCTNGDANVLDLDLANNVVLRTDHYNNVAGGPPIQHGGGATTPGLPGPGAGFQATGFLQAQNVTSNEYSEFMLWSDGNGHAVIYNLDGLGAMISSINVNFPLVGTGWSAHSISGAPREQLICDLCHTRPECCINPILCQGPR